MAKRSRLHCRDQAERFRAASVVVATGAYQRPHVPAFGALLDPGLVQLAADEYRRPAQLPTGGVLVVGSGQSGVQIADDLLQSGRRIYLSVSSCGWVPRRYRGHDIAWWLVEMDFLEKTVDNLSSPEARLACFPQVSGTDGGHDLNVHTFAQDGAILLGRVLGAERDAVFVASDLEQNLADADAFASRVRQAIDSHARRLGVEHIHDDAWPESNRQFDSPPLPTGRSQVSWNYKHHLGLRLPARFSLDQFANIRSARVSRSSRGVSNADGLYFLGLPWLYKWKSATLLGAGEDAAFIAQRIASTDLR